MAAPPAAITARPHAALATAPQGVALDEPGESSRSAILADRLLAWADDAAFPTRALRFSERAAREALGGSPRSIAHACALLERRGALVRRLDAIGGRHRGWSRPGVIVERKTLADLLRLVESAPEPAQAGRAGRKSAAAREAPISELLRNQKTELRWVGGLIAECAPGGRGDAGNVAASYLARTTTLDGRVAWALEVEIAEMVEQRGRAAASTSGKSYEPSPRARTRATSGARLLLHFASSIGWLPEPEEQPSVVHTWAAEWHPVILRWRARLGRWAGGRSTPAIRLGLQTLALYATRRGHLHPLTTPWTAVLDDVEADAGAGLLRTNVLQAVRFVWRLVPRLRRLRPVTRAQEQRWSVVPYAVIERTVASLATAGSAADVDFTGWVDATAGRSLDGLIEGPHGLRRWVWYTAADSNVLAADVSLPERRYELTYTRRLERKEIGAVTLERRLCQIALLAGWAVREEGVDLASATCGLSPLLDPQRLERFRLWRATQPVALTTGASAKGAKGGNGHLGGILDTANRAAGDLVFFAEHDAEHGLRVPTTITERDRVVLRRMRRKAHSEDGKFRDCIAINDAWRADGGDWGLVKLVRLRDLLVADAVRSARGRSVDAQLQDLRAFRAAQGPLINSIESLETLIGEMARSGRGNRTEAEARLRVQCAKLQHAAAAAMPWRAKTWALELRRAFLTQFGRKLPLRERALRELRRSMIEARTRDGRAAQPWDPGAVVRVTVPGEFTKSGDPYVQAYVGLDQAGVPEHEADAARWLIELWLAPGGGLDLLIAGAPPSVARDEQDYVLPADPARGQHGHGRRDPRTTMRFSEESLSADVQRIIRRHGRTLGIDLKALASIHGGETAHIFRYLAGRYWAHARKDIDYASDLLHHGDLVVTKRRYVGADRGTTSRIASATLDADSGTVGMQVLLDRLLAAQTEIAALRQRLVA